MATVNFQTGQQYTFYNASGTMSNVSGIAVIDHGVWDPTKFYAGAARDAVSYSGNYYICLRPNTGQRPPIGENRNFFWSRILGVEADVYTPPAVLPTLKSLSDRITAIEPLATGLLTGNYDGNPPNTTPSSPTFALDLDSGTLWCYTGTAWCTTGLQLNLTNS